MTFRTSPPEFYIPPSPEEMREAADKAGVRTFSRDLVADFCNLVAGGRINHPSSYMNNVLKRVEERLQEPDMYGRWKSPRGYAKNRHDALRAWVSWEMQYHQNVCDFLQTLEFDKFPGSSPLEKAMNILKLLSAKYGREGRGEENGTPIPIFLESGTEKFAKELNHIMEDVDSLSEAEKELLDPEGSDNYLRNMKIAEDMAKGKEVILKISRQLDSMSKMAVKRSAKVESYPEGDEVRYRQIRHLGELGRIPAAEWALPNTYRLYRAISRMTPVRERARRTEKKQLLYILIDCSGSMEDGQRIFKAFGVLMNRLKAVLAGDAELYVRLFDESLRTEHFAATPEEAKKLMNTFSERNFSGGGTDISGCVLKAHSRIEEIMREGRHHRPELVVVTDGDDKITIGAKDISGTRLHAFVVENRNEKLINLAKNTGGVGIYL
jgi:Mg-chelatase subunit ChlD